jgi:predicted nucleic acid-binding protein
MNRIFLDTNIWLRYLIADEPSSFEDCKKLIGLINRGKFRPYTSDIVFLEINYVLLSYYGIDKEKVVSDLKDLTKTRNLTIVEKTDLNRAMELYDKTNVKLGDCLIASQVPEKLMFCSYDQDFKKFDFLNWQTPKQILKTTLN